ncbi:MAG: peptide chain release factor 2 [Deltaproteobacteria bacterium]|nr:MAG: peptide chain release factor 2 [Deltaproteobacteria bacterium]
MYREKLKSLRERLNGLGGIFDLVRRKERLLELNDLMAAPDFWDDAEKAQQLNQERGACENLVKAFAALAQELEDVEAFIELGAEMGEDEVAADLDASIERVDGTLGELEFKRMLSGKHDPSDAIVSINAGAGGTESQDWAEMLLRMYLRFCEKQGWKTEMIDYQDGEEAGIKGATFSVRGEYAFGYLRAESGVHRLVRISPFDSQARRHTSFASVYVLPELDDDIVVDIQDKDLRVDTYRASGAGGQHVNRTDSAVRITHLPTGIVVQCQQERSQIKNRSRAMKVLQARLYEEERRKREAEAQAANDAKSEIGWGSQIRSYVLQPYRMVKDLRTAHESGNPDAILDGALMPFIEAYLLQYADSQSPAAQG